MSRPTLPDDGVSPAIYRYPPEDREKVRAQQLRMCASTVRRGGEEADFLVTELLAGGWLKDPLDALRWIQSLRSDE